MRADRRVDDHLNEFRDFVARDTDFVERRDGPAVVLRGRLAINVLLRILSARVEHRLFRRIGAMEVQRRASERYRERLAIERSLGSHRLIRAEKFDRRAFDDGVLDAREAAGVSFRIAKVCVAVGRDRDEVRHLIL